MNFVSNEDLKRGRSRWLTRTVLGIGLASLFSDASHETVTVLLPAYLASMGAAAAVLGTIEGSADGLSSAAKLYGGWLADRVRRRKVVAASGYGVMAISPLVIAAATTWPLLLLGRVTAWISRGLRTPARKALLADAVTPESYGRAFGLERAMDTCGAIIAPAACYLLLAHGVGHRTLIYWSAVPAILAVAAIVFLVRERTDREPVTTPFVKSFRGFGRSYREFLVAVGLFGVGDFADTFYILYATAVLTPKIGGEKAASFAVGFYVLHNVLYASWSYLGGWLADRVNRRVLVACGYACAASAAAFMIAGAASYLGLGFMFALGGMGVGIYEAGEDTVAAELLPRESRGSGFGALSVVTGMGDFVSSLLFGWLWSAFGAARASICILVPMLIGVTLMFHLGYRNRRTPRGSDAN